MTDLTQYLGDPLIAALDDVLTKDHMAESPRDYIGASGINSECDRKIWLQYHGFKAVFPPRVLRAIQDGHDTEEKIIKWLEQIPGIQVFHTLPDGGQYGFSDLDGKYKGHYDGIIKGIPQAPNTWHILEVKCVAEKYFKQLQKIIETHGEKNALKEWRPDYYGQAVSYMWYEKLTRHLTIVASAGGRDLLTIRTEQNHKFAKQLRDKAARLLEMKEPPERIGGETYFKCRMCSLHGVCHR